MRNAAMLAAIASTSASATRLRRPLRNRHAPLARRPNARRSRRRPPARYPHRASPRGGSSRHRAPAPLARRRPGPVHVPRDRRRSHEAHGRDVGCSRSRSTASLSPCTTLNTPAGRPPSERSAAIYSDGLVLFPRLHHKGVAARIAVESIHIGTIAGKLKGVIPAQTPSGWRSEKLSTPEHLLAERPLEQLRHAAGELHVLDAARDLAHRVRHDLAVLRRDQRRELLAPRRAARGHETALPNVATATRPATPGTPRSRRRPRGQPRRATRGRRWQSACRLPGRTPGPSGPTRRRRRRRRSSDGCSAFAQRRQRRAAPSRRRRPGLGCRPHAGPFRDARHAGVDIPRVLPSGMGAPASKHAAHARRGRSARAARHQRGGCARRGARRVSPALAPAEPARRDEATPARGHQQFPRRAHATRAVHHRYRWQRRGG